MLSEAPLGAVFPPLQISPLRLRLGFLCLPRWASVPFVFSCKETCNRIHLLLCLHKNRLFLAIKPSFVIIQNWIMHFNIAVFSIYAGQIHTYLRIIRGAVLQFPFQTPKMPQNRTNLSQKGVLMPKRGIFLTR